MKSSAATLFVALVFGAFCCVYSKENIHDTGLADSSSDSAPHMARKRSLDDDVLGSGTAFISGNSDVSDDSPLDKRSSLFRFGKRQFRYGKRQFRYGKRDAGDLFLFDTGLTDSPSDTAQHMARKRSLDDEASVLGSGAAFISGNSDVSDDSPLDKRSSLFRFGKRQFRYGKRQFRYGKRQGGSLFRFGKRNSLLRFGKRGGGGALFRFGRSGGDAPFNYPISSYEGLTDAERTEILRAMLDAYLSSVEDFTEDGEVETKRDAPGFHWGSDE